MPQLALLPQIGPLEIVLLVDILLPIWLAYRMARRRGRNWLVGAAAALLLNWGGFLAYWGYLRLTPGANRLLE